MLGLGSLLYWQRGAIGDLASGIAMLVRPSTAPAPRETAPAQPKITDRVGQPAPEPAGGVGVAQRVVLYEEDPQDPQGKRYIGTVLWRTEMRPATPGRPPELAVRGDIEVPERNMSVTCRFAATPISRCRRATPSRSCSRCRPIHRRAACRRCPAC